MAEKKIRDEKHKIPDARGNGKLRREVWVDNNGKVTRYNLAYINHKIYPGDNGRVLGFDNQHEGHHKHIMGVVVPVEFVSFEALEDQFDEEWQQFRKGR